MNATTQQEENKRNTTETILRFKECQKFQRKEKKSEDGAWKTKSEENMLWMNNFRELVFKIRPHSFSSNTLQLAKSTKEMRHHTPR